MTWMPALRRYCLAIVGEPQDAEDVMQETFIEAHRAFGRFQRDADFGAWLRGIARNVAARRREKLTRVTRLRVSLEPQVVDRLEALCHAEETTDQAPVEVLKQCLGKLSSEDRELVRGRYEQEAGLESLCRELHRTLSWAKTRLMRLRWMLAECVTRGLRRSARTGGAAP